MIATAPRRSDLSVCHFHDRPLVNEEKLLTFPFQSFIYSIFTIVVFFFRSAISKHQSGSHDV